MYQRVYKIIPMKQYSWQCTHMNYAGHRYIGLSIWSWNKNCKDAISFLLLFCVKLPVDLNTWNVCKFLLLRLLSFQTAYHKKNEYQKLQDECFFNQFVLSLNSHDHLKHQFVFPLNQWFQLSNKYKKCNLWYMAWKYSKEITKTR